MELQLSSFYPLIELKTFVTSLASSWELQGDQTIGAPHQAIITQTMPAQIFRVLRLGFLKWLGSRQLMWMFYNPMRTSQAA